MNKPTPTKFSFSYLFSLMTQYRAGIMVIILLNLLWTVFQICIPFLTQALVDSGIQNQDMDIVWIILIAQFVIFIGIILTDIYRKWMLRHIGVRVNLQLILQFLSGIIKKPYSFFNLSAQGSTIQHFNDNLRIEAFLTNKSSDFFNNMLKLVTFGVLLFIFSKHIGYVYILFNVLLVLWIFLFLRTREHIDEERFRLSSLVRTELIEIFSGIIDLKSYNQETNRVNSWDRVQTNFSDIRLNMLRINQLIFGGINSLSYIRDLFIIFLAAKATIEGSMTLGTLLAIQYILGNLNQPIRDLIDFVPQYQDAKLSLGRINNALSYEEDSSPSLSNNIPSKADISIQELSYTYNKKKMAVSDIDIVIPYGKSIALLGESGSGKSTLMKLMLKLLITDDGEILIGPKKLTLIHSKSWLGKCSVVLQDSILFQKSIMYNIAFEEEKDKVDIDRVYECLTLCDVVEVVDALPDGLDSIIGHNNVNFSKGQVQRLLLARVLYKDVDYFFFDEPFSALDRLTYRKVFKNIRTQLKDKTLIIVTHKMEVAKEMDFIYLLEEGRLVESGTHETLSALGKQYSKIFLEDE